MNKRAKRILAGIKRKKKNENKRQAESKMKTKTEKFVNAMLTGVLNDLTVEIFPNFLWKWDLKVYATKDFSREQIIQEFIKPKYGMEIIKTFQSMRDRDLSHCIIPFDETTPDEILGCEICEGSEEYTQERNLALAANPDVFKFNFGEYLKAKPDTYEFFEVHWIHDFPFEVYDKRVVERTTSHGGKITLTPLQAALYDLAGDLRTVDPSNEYAIKIGRLALKVLNERWPELNVQHLLKIQFFNENFHQN